MGKIKTLLYVALFFAGHAHGQIVLSEIMFNPPGNDRYNEFLELYNMSDADSIDLARWLLSDGERFNVITEWSQGTKIAPHQYALILVPKYFSESHFYDADIPASALLLTINKATLGRNGFANSRPETISIYTPDTVLVASWRYSTPVADGYSIEKRILGRGDVAQNWAVSTVHGGTPGFINSVTPPDYDLAIEAMTFVPESPTFHDSITVTCLVQNLGAKTVANASIHFYLDTNHDDQPQEHERISGGDFTLAPLDWLDSIQVETKIPPLSIGEHTVIARVYFPADQNPENNLALTRFRVQAGMADVVINEIYHRPAEGQECWIEILNKSSQTIDLYQWKLFFPSHNNSVARFANHFLLQPESLLIVTQFERIADPFWQTRTKQVSLGFPDLNRMSDRIILANASDAVIDSVFYDDPSDDAEKISLERGPLANDSTRLWAHCPHPNGSTPGEANALGQDFYDMALNSYSATIDPAGAYRGQELMISCRVHNYGTLPGRSRVQLFSITKNSELADTLKIDETRIDDLAARDSTSVRFLYPHANPGFYSFLLRLQSQEDFYTVNNSALIQCRVGYRPGDLVINEIMYDTEERSQEWIELYNPNDFSVDIQNWSVRDSRKKVTMAGAFSIAPGAFVVVSNTAIAGLDSSNNIVVSGLPELNNSGDLIVLMDATNRVIDSVRYVRQWGGDRMLSLERIRFEDASQDSLNWSSCVDPAGSTPGRQNSVSPLEYDALIIPGSITLRPDKPTAEQTGELRAVVENFGRKKLKNVQVSFSFAAVASGAPVKIGEPFTIDELEPRAQETATCQWPLMPAGTYRVHATVIQVNDQVAANDSTSMLVTISYTASPLVINEFMYNPAPEVPEWVELFNNGSSSVQLLNWRLSDSDTSKSMFLSTAPFSLDAGGYVIVSKDSSISNYLKRGSTPLLVNKKFPTLNNDTDEIIIKDANGRIMDRVCYRNQEDRQGYSVERINPSVPSQERSNWVTCVDPSGHTAGQANSVYTVVLPPSVSISITPNPFSPDGDGFDDVAAITFNLPATTAMVNLKIYDIKGRMVRFLVNNEASGTQRTVFWNGKNDDGQLCRMGVYILFLQALDMHRQVLEQARKTVILAFPL